MSRRPKIFRKPSRVKKEIGLAPGTLTYTGEKDTSALFVEIYEYDSDTLETKIFDNVDKALKIECPEKNTWININGLRHTDAIEKLGKHFKLHPLLMEDVVNVAQRPKLDEYEDCLFAVFKMLYYNDGNELKIEQVSIVLGTNYVLTFQEAEGDVFDSVRNRIK
jgi:magnesium transporter